MSKKSPGIQLPLAGSELWSAMAHSLPLIASDAANPQHGFVSLKVTYRGEHDWLAVGKKYDDSGVVVVCFGSGPDFVGALLGLERAIDQDKWRPDKYQNLGR